MNIAIYISDYWAVLNLVLRIIFQNSLKIMNVI